MQQSGDLGYACGWQKAVVVFNEDQAGGNLGVVEGAVIIKIDVEGAELKVHRGLEDSIERLRPFVILDILPSNHFSQSVNDYRLKHAEKLTRHMADRSYAVHAIGTAGETCSGVSPTRDYPFVPNERSDSVGITAENGLSSI